MSTSFRCLIRPRLLQSLSTSLRSASPQSQLCRQLGTSVLRQNNASSSSSVDPTEVSHFNALASTWWDPKGSSRILHLMNPMRIEFVQSCLARGAPSSSSSNLTYLDVGCGGGIYTESIARLHTTAKVTGVDPSSEVYAIAVSHAKGDPALKTKLNYVQTSVDNLDPNAQYDVVSLFEVIEHVPYPADFLHTCMRHVKPGGWLVLSTIARTWTSWVTTKLVAEDMLRIVPRGTHDWHKYINEEEMRDFFRREDGWGNMVSMGCLYVPGLGWREVRGGEKFGNYFFAARRDPLVEAEQ